MNRKQENIILKKAKEIEKKSAWNQAKRNGFPTSDAMYGKQYCRKCQTIINVEGTIKPEDKMLDGCFVCTPCQPC